MRELRLVLLGLAAVIALVLGGGFLLRAFKVETSQPPQPVASSSAPSLAETPLRATLSPQALTAARAKVERAIVDAPDYARFFDRLRLVFPTDYDAILNTIGEAYQGRDVNVGVFLYVIDRDAFPGRRGRGYGLLTAWGTLDGHWRLRLR